MKQTADEKMLDAMEDAEMYLGGAIEEMESSLRDMRKAKATLHMRRMSLAKKVKAHG
jgi:phage shock protein A